MLISQTKFQKKALPTQQLISFSSHGFIPVFVFMQHLPAHDIHFKHPNKLTQARR